VSQSGNSVGQAEKQALPSANRARPPIAVLIIFDGWGLRKDNEGNAIAMARTPTMDRLCQTYPHTAIEASGEAVGLEPGIMGNSEVGHLTIGSGRAIFQDLLRIKKAIETGEFDRNPVLCAAIDKAANGHTLHIWGLLSDGSVHSHIDHLFALLELAAERGANKIAAHAVLDGRDKPPRSALPFIHSLEAKLERLGVGKIATVSGRYFAMDRDQRWERTQQAWRTIVNGEGPRCGSAREALEQAYAGGKNDEFVEPIVIGEPSPIQDDDQVVCFNFRADRVRQMTAAIALEPFSGFARSRFPRVGYVCMTEYDARFHLPLALAPVDVSNTLAEVFGANGIHNLRIAETEKYAHVTYFLNGGIEQPYPCEERVLIPSPKVATYDLQPTMSAAGIAARVEQEIDAGRFRVIVVNLANPDMVGHTGNLEATVQAVETADQALGRIVTAVEKKAGVVLITSDHGNAEFMTDPATGQAHTAHTTNPVPLVVVDSRFKGSLKEGGTLRDVAPTFLKMIGMEIPREMTGHDLRIPTP
jgi:2,3-bisphosphoglycerate-independent phosphoglycerate mutase